MGVTQVDFLDEVDGAVVYSLDLRRQLARVMRQVRPDLVVTGHFGLAWGPGPGGSANQADHRAVGLATLDAARDAGNRWIFPELLDEGLEPHHVRWVAVSGTPTPSHAIVIDEADLKAGIASLEAHARYLAGLSSPTDVRAFLTELAEGAGVAADSRYAVVVELFET